MSRDTWRDPDLRAAAALAALVLPAWIALAAWFVQRATRSPAPWRKGEAAAAPEQARPRSARGRADQDTKEGVPDEGQAGEADDRTVRDAVLAVRQLRRLLEGRPMRRRSNRPWAKTDAGYGGAGLASSTFENECSRCGEDIEDWRDATKTGRGKWIHKRCASGAEDV